MVAEEVEEMGRIREAGLLPVRPGASLGIVEL
jgi:hypothetical protein